LAIALTWAFDSWMTPRDSAGGDTKQIGGADRRVQSLFGPAAAFEEPVWEVAALPQLGDGELDGPGAGVPLARVVAVAVVVSLVADLPVFGVAGGVGFRGHERVGECLDHRAQQIGTRRGEIVFREGLQGQTNGPPTPSADRHETSRLTRCSTGCTRHVD
jgi:hypothetical protein